MDIDAAIVDHLTTVENSRQDLLLFCQKAIEFCLTAWSNNKHLYICGNGGSAADATHIVGELVGKLRNDSPPCRATCLGADFATMTAVTNDYGYEYIFAREIRGKALPGDILWCLSTSGNSANVIQAVLAARKIGDIKIIGMSGKTGGKLKNLCDICLCVPHTFSARIQEIHELAYHIICEGIEQQLLTEEN